MRLSGLSENWEDYETQQVISSITLTVTVSFSQSDSTYLIFYTNSILYTIFFTTYLDYITIIFPIEPSNDSSSLSKAVLIGIIVAAVAVVFLIAGISVFLYRRTSARAPPLFYQNKENIFIKG